MSCPGCGIEFEITPEEFLEVLDRFRPEKDWEDWMRCARDSTLIAENWHRCGKLRTTLQHRGTALGPPTERELLPMIVHALLKSKPPAEEEV